MGAKRSFESMYNEAICGPKKRTFSHQSIQTIDQPLSDENNQTIQKKRIMKLQTIEEDISSGNSPALKEKLNENLQAAEEKSLEKKVQVAQRKLFTKLQTIQEDIFNVYQILDEAPSHENNHAVEKESYHRTNQPIRDEISYENVQNAQNEEVFQKERSHVRDQITEKDIIQEESSDESAQAVKETSLERDIRAIDEMFSHIHNYVIEDDTIQKESSDESTTQDKSLNEGLQNIEEGPSSGNVQAMVRKSSCTNDQCVEKFPYEKIQETHKKSSSDNDENEEVGPSHTNIQTTNRKCSDKNNETQENPSDESIQTTQDESFNRNAQDVENAYANVYGDYPADDQRTKEDDSRENGRCCTWIKKISIEPTMWLYMMAFMFTSVIEQAFFVHKACLVDHGLSEEICSHLHDHEDMKKDVQKTVSIFQQWYNFAGHIVPIILALFFGNWSDRRGRKLPLVIGLTGKLIYSLMVVINSLMDNWNLNMVTYTAVIPMGLLGGDVMIFGSCFAYLTDICSLEERTLRITILDVIYLSTMPTGIALGSYVFTKVNSSYTIMFAINSFMLVLAIVYSLVRLKWQTSSRQESFIGVNFFKDFFDLNHVRQTTNMMIKWRPNNGRACLMLIMLSMCLYTFQREERSMSYLYTQLVFNWDVAKFSNFRTFQSSLFVAAMLCATPCMKFCKFKDTVITIIGAISHALGRVVFVIATTGKEFYAGAVVAALGPVVAPALRSMASKYVLIEERGKVFAVLSVFDNAVPLISSFLYSQVYNATMNSVPNFIYWLTFITQICVILIAIVISLAPWNLRRMRR